MKIWLSPYQLYPKGSLNAKTSVKSPVKFRKGMLMRVRFDDGLVGYADVCPYPEMGDRPLELELKHIFQKKPSPLGERSLHFARLDAEARNSGVSLYKPEVKIKNHFLIPDLAAFDFSRIEKIQACGFIEFKLKTGRDLPGEAELLQKFVAKLAPQARLRLDFNGGYNRDRFTEWFEKNQNIVRPHLEFIEDPFTYDAKDWREVSQKYGLTFALDLAADALETSAEGAQIIVVKPAVQDERKIIAKYKDSGKKFVFTHYMDFPVGQMCAYVAAQNIQSLIPEQLLTCGLQHHDLYEGFTFQDAIKHDGPYLLPPEGPGLGFEKLLGNMQWTEL